MSAYRRLKALRVLHVNAGFAALPDTPGSEADMRAIAAHINNIWGATASLLRADALDGCNHLVAAYNAERDVEYAELTAACDTFLRECEESSASDDLRWWRRLARLTKRFDDTSRRDVFEAPGREAAARTLGACRIALLPA